MVGLGDGGDDLFLAPKVAVDGAGAEVGLAADLLYRRLVKAVAAEASRTALYERSAGKLRT